MAASTSCCRISGRRRPEIIRPPSTSVKMPPPDAYGRAPALATPGRFTAGLHWHRHVHVGTARHLCGPPRHQWFTVTVNHRRSALAIHLLHRLRRWTAVAICGARHEPALGPAPCQSTQCPSDRLRQAAARRRRSGAAPGRLADLHGKCSVRTRPDRVSADLGQRGQCCRRSSSVDEAPWRPSRDGLCDPAGGDPTACLTTVRRVPMRPLVPGSSPGRIASAHLVAVALTHRPRSSCSGAKR